MEGKVKTAMAVLVIIGMIGQGIFGIAIGIFISAVIGVIFGIMKKNKLFVKWSVIALVIDTACIITFIVLLMNSNM